MITDASAIRMALPEYPTDKVIGIFTGSFSVAAPTAAQGTVYAEDAQNHGFGDTFLPQLIYSTGGVYNDQDMTVPRLTGAFPVFQTLDVTAYTTSTQVIVAATNWYDNVAGAGFAWNITYKIFCLAKKNQGILVPKPTDQLLRYSSADNYQKIFTEDIVPITVPGAAGSTSYTVSHNIGIVPTTRAYVEYANGKLWPCSPNEYQSTGETTINNPITSAIKLTETTAEYDFTNNGASNATINLHYRIYLDD